MKENNTEIRFLLKQIFMKQFCTKKTVLHLLEELKLLLLYLKV